MITKRQKKQLEAAISDFEKLGGTYPDWLFGAMQWLTKIIEENGEPQPELRDFCIKIKENQIKALQKELDELKNQANS